MSFTYGSKNISTRALLDDEVEAILDDEDTGELKSQVHYHDGEIRRKGYTVAFRRLVEVHGALDMPPETQSFGASSPLDNGTYEPAADGDEYFQKLVIDVKKTSNSEAGIGLHAPTGAEGTLKSSWATEKSFEKRRRLKLSSTSTGLHKGTDTEVTFELTPASGEDGIGDSLAVALVVQRSPGTNFYIVARATASVNARLKDFLPKVRSGPHRRERRGSYAQRRLTLETYDKPPATSSRVWDTSTWPRREERSYFVQQAAVPDPVTASKSANRPAPPPHALEAGLKHTQADGRGGSTALQPGRSLFAIQTSRAARHRLMSAHYQSLAQLHQEEADEVESLLEMVYLGQATNSALFQI
ncbi:uncharacterized protein B0T15DRAFT_575287 [Chaetomium strumarium]|uniref:Uncharacterized protein n=1 Tax=Chaetomium strumarium TaxID=1170767 RepID=A0AAJ0M215_9PEZI|nr:hypothetical protein B0T15DRAFT_575287 [Chaetomium strumarium]